MRKQTLLTDRQIDAFISKHRLPGRCRHLIDAHYSPLTAWIIKKRPAGRTLVVGISGAQGTGKSTLAAFFREALRCGKGWNVAVLSIDDFYLTRQEREQLAADIHPLLEIRGVPGTHDVKLLSTCIDNLRHLVAGDELRTPVFDKARDDRADTEVWPAVSGPVDVIVLEGWCVASTPQENDALVQAVNALEAQQDATGEWRQFVNDQLAGGYADVFSQLDALVYLKAPDFEAVYRWRLEQEEKLAAVTLGDRTGIMNKEQIADFIQHYERITRANFSLLPGLADVVLELDAHHDCVRSYYSTRSE
ncbi:MAG: hypothetical protein GXP15_13525 [Gammaproteobacteria bacterium]|nr:hypothetical protein [Gammaproteobacteria bacterium]